MSQNWFEEWFDSPLYYELYSGRNELDAVKLLNAVQRFLPAPPARVLDLACGRGRHALNLAAAGYRVTGVDLAASALDHARSEAGKRNLNIEFIRGDMRQPLPGPYDAVVNLFTSFGYFHDPEENAVVFQRVADALPAGGVFIFDFLNAHVVRRTLVPRESGEWSGGMYGIVRKIEEPFVLKEVQIHHNSGSTTYFHEKVHLLDDEWIKRQTARFGLFTTSILGDYNGEPFNRNQSPRFIGIFQAMKGNQPL